MTRKPLLLLALLLAALALTACGAPTTESWPALVSDGQTAYIAFNAHLYAVDIATGREVWAFPTIPAGGGGFFSFLSASPPTPNSSTSHFYSIPALDENILVVAAVRPSASHSGVVFGLDPATGVARWCVAFEEKSARAENSQSTACTLLPRNAGTGLFGIAPPADNRIVSGITLTDGVAYFGLASGEVYAVNALEGAPVWATPFQTGNSIWGAPHANGDLLYVSSLDHSLYALNRANGALVWSKDLGAAIGGAPTIADGRVFVGTFGKELYALDAATGEKQWSIPTNNWIWDHVVVEENTLYFTDLSGAVTALDAATGVTQWTVTPGGALRAAPALVGDKLYIGDRKGQLFALNRADGSTVWPAPIQLKGELLATPLVVNDRILLTPYNGENLLTGYTTSGQPTSLAFKPSK